MAIEDGLYIIHPQDSDKDALLIGPVPLIFPPPDVPVRVAEKPIDRWLIQNGENDAATVFAGSGKPNDYKWIVKNNVLYVSSVSPPNQFRFETAGQGLYEIAIPNQNLVLTFDRSAFPPLVFRKADGSSNQRFKATRIDRE